ncbi:NAD(P)H-binding protein [Amycolatopsis anabasis]|uniref:NAD(P)H-binding protein n=1 Tax=Amycolatopsis anabasis TaxID=1840409 RepID=UPI00131E712A|nr:NAD(P)H-binding protein [Amycolatopsis anabasis]
MILITGATGKVGRELVPCLLDRGAPVRALTRDPGAARVDPRAEVVAGDLDRPETLPPVLEGVDRVFVLTSGHGSTGPVQEANLAAAAAHAGVERLVKLSTTGVHFGGADPISSAHREAEEVIRAAGPDWTILRPGTFMDNRYGWIESVRAEGVAYVNQYEGPSAMIHCRDIATVAAEVLTSPGHAGAIYPLTGGEAPTPEEQVRALADALGRPVRCVVESAEQTRTRFASWGWPVSAVDGILEMKRAAGHTEAIVFDTVDRLTGRKPLTFSDWARENAVAFG